MSGASADATESRIRARLRENELKCHSTIESRLDALRRDSVLPLQRGVPVRLMTDPGQTKTYAGQAPYEAAIRAAGAQIRYRVHKGMTHEKFMLFHSDGTTVVPTNNLDPWTSRSATLFTQDAYIYAWGVTHFIRKWETPTEFR